jgi:ABC-type branched-subunit amino acid transport system ATPase component
VATLVARNANESTIESGGRGTGAKARKIIQQPMLVMLDECAVGAMRNNIIATLVARNVNEATAAPMLGTGGICVWRKYEV